MTKHIIKFINSVYDFVLHGRRVPMYKKFSKNAYERWYCKEYQI